MPFSSLLHSKVFYCIPPPEQKYFQTLKLKEGWEEAEKKGAESANKVKVRKTNAK